MVEGAIEKDYAKTYFYLKRSMLDTLELVSQPPRVLRLPYVTSGHIFIDMMEGYGSNLNNQPFPICIGFIKTGLR